MNYPFREGEEKKNSCSQKLKGTYAKCRMKMSLDPKLMLDTYYLLCPCCSN